MNRISRNKKIILSVITLVIVGVSIAFSVNHFSKVKAEEIRIAEQQQNDKKIKSYNQTLRNYYSDKTYQMLSAKVTKKDVTNLQKEMSVTLNQDLSGASKTTLKNLIAESSLTLKMLDVEQSVKALFDVKGILVEKAPITKFEKQLDALKDEKAKFVKFQSKKLNEAKKQQKSMDQATKEVEKLFDGKKIAINVSNESYNRAVELVSQVKNKTLNKELSTRLEKVASFLAKQEKAKADKQALAVQNEEKQSKVVANDGTVIENTAPAQSNGGGSNNNTAPAQSNGGGSNNNTAPAQSNGGGSNNNTAPAQSNGGGSNNNTAPAQSNGGSSNNNKAPAQSNGGGSNNNTAPAKPSKPSKPSGGNSWNGNQTGGGTISGGATGGAGDNTWTGGEFNPGDLDW